MLPSRTVQQKPIWSVQVPFRAGVMALPGLLESQHLPLNIPLSGVSCLLLAAY